MATTKKPSAGVEDEHIRVAAYHIWNEEGQPDGKAEEHWSRAREQLTVAKPAKPAKAPARKAAAPKAPPKAAAKPAAKAVAAKASETKVTEKKKPAPAKAKSKA